MKVRRFVSYLSRVHYKTEIAMPGQNLCFAMLQKRILRFIVVSCLMLFVITKITGRTRYQQSAQERSIPEVNGASAHAQDDLRYRPRPEANNSEVGLVLREAGSYKEFLDKPLSSAIELTQDNAGEFVFVIASDSNFFHQAMDAIGNVQGLFPNRSIIFYDLDEKMSPADIEKIPGLCGVSYRKFDFAKFPKHVRNLYNYAWKPLIIAELLSEYHALFYIDAAVRFLSSNLSIVFPQAIQNGGVVTFGFAGHPIFPTTHSGMYRYLPLRTEKAVKVPMREAGHIYVARTREIYANVVRWWAACALVEPCFAPTMKRYCNFHGVNVYADCHRFDQSAFNILLANHFVYDAEAYSYANIAQSYEPSLTVVRRGSSHKEDLAICPKDGKKRSSKSSEYFGQSSLVKRISWFLFG